ncbi:transposase family protein [Streptomyces acidicola]|uniref:transposase family protein n=1 Tax=Streptomyces acidicola TaxID=2596892 RepID=UPI003423D5BD
MPACVISSHPALDQLRRAGESRECAPDRGGLLRYLAAVPDPRRRRGVRHSLVVILAVAACAVLAGATSLSAIDEWVQDTSPDVLEALKARAHPVSGARIAPSESTIRRVLETVDGDAFDTAVCGWFGGQARHDTAGKDEPDGRGKLRPALAVDGKTLRGARTEDGQAGNATMATAAANTVPSSP